MVELLNSYCFLGGGSCLETNAEGFLSIRAAKVELRSRVSLRFEASIRSTKETAD